MVSYSVYKNIGKDKVIEAIDIVINSEQQDGSNDKAALSYCLKTISFFFNSMDIEQQSIARSILAYRRVDAKTKTNSTVIISLLGKLKASINGEVREDKSRVKTLVSKKQRE